MPAMSEVSAVPTTRRETATEQAHQHGQTLVNVQPNPKMNMIYQENNAAASSGRTASQPFQGREVFNQADKFASANDIATNAPQQYQEPKLAHQNQPYQQQQHFTNEQNVMQSKTFPQNQQPNSAHGKQVPVSYQQSNIVQTYEQQSARNMIPDSHQQKPQNPTAVRHSNQLKRPSSIQESPYTKHTDQPIQPHNPTSQFESNQQQSYAQQQGTSSLTGQFSAYQNAKQQSSSGSRFLETPPQQYATKGQQQQSPSKNQLGQQQQQPPPTTQQQQQQQQQQYQHQQNQQYEQQQRLQNEQILQQQQMEQIHQQQEQQHQQVTQQQEPQSHQSQTQPHQQRPQQSYPPPQNQHPQQPYPQKQPHQVPPQQPYPPSQKQSQQQEPTQQPYSPPQTQPPQQPYPPSQKQPQQQEPTQHPYSPPQTQPPQQPHQVPAQQPYPPSQKQPQRQPQYQPPPHPYEQQPPHPHQQQSQTPYEQAQNQPQQQPKQQPYEQPQQQPPQQPLNQHENLANSLASFHQLLENNPHIDTHSHGKIQQFMKSIKSQIQKLSSSRTGKVSVPGPRSSSVSGMISAVEPRMGPGRFVGRHAKIDTMSTPIDPTQQVDQFNTQSIPVISHPKSTGAMQQPSNTAQFASQQSADTVTGSMYLGGVAPRAPVDSNNLVADPLQTGTEGVLTPYDMHTQVQAGKEFLSNNIVSGGGSLMGLDLSNPEQLSHLLNNIVSSPSSAEPLVNYLHQLASTIPDPQSIYTFENATKVDGGSILAPTVIEHHLPPVHKIPIEHSTHLETSAPSVSDFTISETMPLSRVIITALKPKPNDYKIESVEKTSPSKTNITPASVANLERGLDVTHKSNINTLSTMKGAIQPTKLFDTLAEKSNSITISNTYKSSEPRQIIGVSNIFETGKGNDLNWSSPTQKVSKGKHEAAAQNSLYKKKTVLSMPQTIASHIKYKTERPKIHKKKTIPHMSVSSLNKLLGADKYEAIESNIDTIKDHTVLESNTSQEATSPVKRIKNSNNRSVISEFANKNTHKTHTLSNIKSEFTNSLINIVETYNMAEIQQLSNSRTATEYLPKKLSTKQILDIKHNNNGNQRKSNLMLKQQNLPSTKEGSIQINTLNTGLVDLINKPSSYAAPVSTSATGGNNLNTRPEQAKEKDIIIPMSISDLEKVLGVDKNIEIQTEIYNNNNTKANSIDSTSQVTSSLVNAIKSLDMADIIKLTNANLTHRTPKTFELHKHAKNRHENFPTFEKSLEIINLFKSGNEPVSKLLNLAEIDAKPTTKTSEFQPITEESRKPDLELFKPMSVLDLDKVLGTDQIDLTETQTNGGNQANNESNTGPKRKPGQNLRNPITVSDLENVLGADKFNNIETAIIDNKSPSPTFPDQMVNTKKRNDTIFPQFSDTNTQTNTLKNNLQKKQRDENNFLNTRDTLKLENKLFTPMSVSDLNKVLGADRIDTTETKLQESKSKSNNSTKGVRDIMIPNRKSESGKINNISTVIVKSDQNSLSEINKTNTIDMKTPAIETANMSDSATFNIASAKLIPNDSFVSNKTILMDRKFDSSIDLTLSKGGAISSKTNLNLTTILFPKQNNSLNVFDIKQQRAIVSNIKEINSKPQRKNSTINNINLHTTNKSDNITKTNVEHPITTNTMIDCYFCSEQTEAVFNEIQQMPQNESRPTQVNKADLNTGIQSNLQINPGVKNISYTSNTTVMHIETDTSPYYTPPTTPSSNGNTISVGSESLNMHLTENPVNVVSEASPINRAHIEPAFKFRPSFRHPNLIRLTPNLDNMFRKQLHPTHVPIVKSQKVIPPTIEKISTTDPKIANDRSSTNKFVSITRPLQKTNLADTLIKSIKHSEAIHRKNLGAFMMDLKTLMFESASRNTGIENEPSSGSKEQNKKDNITTKVQLTSLNETNIHAYALNNSTANNSLPALSIINTPTSPSAFMNSTTPTLLASSLHTINTQNSSALLVTTLANATSVRNITSNNALAIASGEHSNASNSSTGPMRSGLVEQTTAQGGSASSTAEIVVNSPPKHQVNQEPIVKPAHMAPMSTSTTGGMNTNSPPQHQVDIQPIVKPVHSSSRVSIPTFDPNSIGVEIGTVHSNQPMNFGTQSGPSSLSSGSVTKDINNPITGSQQPMVPPNTPTAFHVGPTVDVANPPPFDPSKIQVDQNMRHGFVSTRSGIPSDPLFAQSGNSGAAVISSPGRQAGGAASTGPVAPTAGPAATATSSVPHPTPGSTGSLTAPAVEPLSIIDAAIARMTTEEQIRANKMKLKYFATPTRVMRLEGVLITKPVAEHVEIIKQLVAKDRDIEERNRRRLEERRRRTRRP